MSSKVNDDKGKDDSDHDSIQSDKEDDVGSIQAEKEDGKDSESVPAISSDVSVENKENDNS